MTDTPRHRTRDAILIAAATMLGEDPTARLSVRAVADRAGVSTGSLRHFFPTQQALLDTVVAGLYDIELPDDPIADTTRDAAERLEDCLRLLLAEVGTGERARAHWTSLHRAYVETPPRDDAVQAFLALERLAVHRIARWLHALGEEGLVAHNDVDGHARFLSTVVDGLALERALPGDRARLALEAQTLATAARAVLRDPPSTRGT